MLKKEVRILGLSATPSLKSGTFVVGVIFRGSTWLDGILTCTVRAKTGREMTRLSRAIMKSRQYSQLHAVIISKNQNFLRPNDITELARRVRLPTVLLLKRPPLQRRAQPMGVKQYHLDIHGEHLQVCAKGISFQKTEELFTVGCAPDSHVPEAVRVAELITKQVNRVQSK